MALELFNERERLLRHWRQPTLPPAALQLSPRATQDHNERLYGIEAFMLLHPGGQAVRNTNYDPTTACIASNRPVLTTSNSIYLAHMA
jgi:hypothetical protein